MNKTRKTNGKEQGYQRLPRHLPSYSLVSLPLPPPPSPLVSLPFLPFHFSHREISSLLSPRSTETPSLLTPIGHSCCSILRPRSRDCGNIHRLAHPPSVPSTSSPLVTAWRRKTRKEKKRRSRTFRVTRQSSLPPRLFLPLLFVSFFFVSFSFFSSPPSLPSLSGCLLLYRLLNSLTW